MLASDRRPRTHIKVLCELERHRIAIHAERRTRPMAIWMYACIASTLRCHKLPTVIRDNEMRSLLSQLVPSKVVLALRPDGELVNAGLVNKAFINRRRLQAPAERLVVWSCCAIVTQDDFVWALIQPGRNRWSSISGYHIEQHTSREALRTIKCFINICSISS